MNIHDIYREHRIGSQAFVNAVETHCGLEASRTEIERIARVADTPERFMETWRDDDKWQDDAQSQVHGLLFSPGGETATRHDGCTIDLPLVHEGNTVHVYATDDEGGEDEYLGYFERESEADDWAMDGQLAVACETDDRTYDLDEAFAMYLENREPI